MDAAADRPEFAPPPQPGLVGGLLLALLAHALLLLALMWGLRWQREAQDISAEAELWSALPQQAAPKEVAPPPPPPPAPVVQPQPKPEPQPREADIALQREKERRAEERKRAIEEEARIERDRKRAEAQKREKEREQLLAREREEQQRVAAEKRRKEEEQRRKEKADEQRQAQNLAKLRQDNLRRMQGLAGQSEDPNAQGTAARSSGPSANWAGRVRARVKPNIVFRPDDVAGNPEAVIQVRLAPDGTIVSKKLVKSSGFAGWDDAVLRALDKTEVLPRDIDGRVPPQVELAFRPKD